MTLSEFWQSNRPIFSRLPGVNEVYNTAQSIPDFLTRYWDLLLIDTKTAIDDIKNRQLNPLTCDSEWLDFLAPLCGWDDTHWNPGWSEAGKRKLLANSYSGVSIWKTKGSKDTLSFVLSSVGIRNIIRLDSDFIIGTSEVGDQIGEQPWEFFVYVPDTYQNTSTQREAKRIIDLFSPAWCSYSFVFENPDLFYATVIGLDEDTAIGTDEGQVIKVD